MARREQEAAHHSFGWVLQEGSADDDPRTLPNPNAPPPTAEECMNMRTALERVRRFYDEGDTQLMHMKEQTRMAKLSLDNALSRINAQLNGLQKYPAQHPTRRYHFVYFICL